jgi:hypothetical protein
MPRRFFSLRDPYFDIPRQAGLAFGWGKLSWPVMEHVAYQEQFLHFFRYLFDNLQSNPEENADWKPMPLSLSLRAGAIKVYVLSAVAILEGALAELAAQAGIGEADKLYRRSFGAILDLIETNNAMRAEFEPVWEGLKLLQKYRNFVHVGNAAKDQGAYWKEITNNETAIFRACDETLAFLSKKCE